MLLLPGQQAAGCGRRGGRGCWLLPGGGLLRSGREEESHGERSCRPGWRSRAGGPRRLPLRSAGQSCGHPRSGRLLVGAARGRCPAAAGGAAPPGTASLGSSLRGTLPGTRKRKRRRSWGPASQLVLAGVLSGGSRGGAVRSVLLRSGFLRSLPGWLTSGELLAPCWFPARASFPAAIGASESVPSARVRPAAAEGASRPSGRGVLCHLKFSGK